MPRATEITRIVRRLGSRNDAVVDAARARLCAEGARAVAALVDALEGGSSRVRARAMPILGLIRDPRGREPLAAMLLDRDPRLREIAAHSLARFPSTQAVAALERHLRREKLADVRVALVQALLEQLAAGHERAVGPLLGLLLDPAEDPKVRLAAIALAERLRPSPRREILERLRRDPVPLVAFRARVVGSRKDDAPGRGDARALRRLLRELASPDYETWNRALQRLASCGPACVEPLVGAMRRRAHDPEYCARVGMALKSLGPAGVRGIAAALDRIREPIPLQVLVEVVGALGEKSLVYRLRDVISRIAREASGRSERNGFDPLQRVRAVAHLELARVGSRVAIEDLRSLLRDPGVRLEAEVPAALERIGARDEIPALLAAYLREDRLLRQRIGQAVRAIMKRERIRRRDPIFRSLAGRERRAMDSVFPPPRANGRSAGRRAVARP